MNDYSKFMDWLRVNRPEVKLLEWQKDYARDFLTGKGERYKHIDIPKGSGLNYISDLLEAFLDRNVTTYEESEGGADIEMP